MPLYSASKHAVLGFMRSFAVQLGPEHITVNAVCPNITRKSCIYFTILSSIKRTILNVCASSGSNLSPPEVFDMVQAQGRLTSNETVTSAFISFLGDNTANGSCGPLHFIHV